MSKEQIISTIKEYLEQEQIHYGYNAEEELFTFGFSELDFDFGAINVYVHIHEAGATSYAAVPMNAKEKVRPAVAEFVTRANYGLIFGNFELDMRDGEVRFKNNIYAGHFESAPEEACEGLFMLAVAMFYRYGDELLKVMIGAKTAEEAIEAVENADDEDEE